MKLLLLTSHAQRVCGQHPLRVLQRFFARRDSECERTESRQSVSTLSVGTHSRFPPESPARPREVCLIEYPIGKSPRPPAYLDAARGSVGRSEEGMTPREVHADERHY